MRSTGPVAKIRGLVMARDAGRCRRCHGIGEQIHHRTPRGLGGTRNPKINSPENLVLLCASCHADIESHRLDAYDTGWLVRRIDNPAEKYLIDNAGLTFCLLPDGSAVVDPPSDPSFIPTSAVAPW